MFDVINEGAKSHLPFSPAIKAGGFVFVSGQASVDRETGEIIEDSFEGEMRRSFENLEAILDAAGCTFKNVVNVKSYLRSADESSKYNEIYREIFSDPFPSRSTIFGLVGSTLKFEVDCIAYKP